MTETSLPGPYPADTIVAHLKDGQRAIFTKFGEDEANCARFDRDGPVLGERLRKAFVALCKMPITYLGRCQHAPEVDFFSNLLREDASEDAVPWVDYHGEGFQQRADLHRLASYLIDTKEPKLFVGNRNNFRLNYFFRTAFFVEVPEGAWFDDHYEELFETLRAMIAKMEGDGWKPIVLTSAGLATKVLIAELAPEFPTTSFLDVGSSFDLLAQKKDTHGGPFTYDDVLAFYGDLIPDGWDTKI